MILVILIIVSVALYIVIGGFSIVKAMSISEKRCSDCSNNRSCYEDHEFVGVIAGVFWPIVIPLALGMFLAKFSSLSELKKDKEKVQREKEITEATHKLELQRIQTKEAELLDRALANTK